MSKTRKDLFSKIEIDEIGLEKLIVHLCLRDDTAENLNLIESALKGDYAGKSVDMAIKLANALAIAGYEEMRENAMSLAYIHESCAKPRQKQRTVMMAQLERGDYFGALEGNQIKSSLFDDQNGIFGARAKKVEHERGHALTMGEMAKREFFNTPSPRKK